TRNPLYFGSFLIAAGFAVAAHWSLLLIVVAFFALVYTPTIEKERVKISARFPDAYSRWEQNVPAFVPRATAWRDPSAAGSERFSPSLYMRHGEWKAALGFILALAWLVLRMRGDLWGPLLPRPLPHRGHSGSSSSRGSAYLLVSPSWPPRDSRRALDCCRAPDAL